MTTVIEIIWARSSLLRAQIISITVKLLLSLFNFRLRTPHTCYTSIYGIRLQEAQPSRRDRSMPRVTEYLSK